MIIHITGSIVFVAIILCIVWEIATTEEHNEAGCLLACGIAAFIGLLVFYSLTGEF